MVLTRPERIPAHVWNDMDREEQEIEAGFGFWASSEYDAYEAAFNAWEAEQAYASGRM